MSRRIETADIERELPLARSRLRECGLPAILAEVDRGAFGTTALNLEMLDALSWAAATAVAASVRSETAGAGAAFAAFVFAEEAFDRLAGIGEPVESGPQKGALPGSQYAGMMRQTDPSALLAELLKDCAAFLRFYAGHADSSKRLCRDLETLRCLRSYLRLLSGTVRSLGPESVGVHLETSRLHFDGWKVSPAEIGEASDLLPIALEDVVGNEAYIKAGTRMARDVAGFDLARGENPKKVRNQVLFVLGTPGCGKTVASHAILRYFLDLCAKHDLPAKTRIIRRTDWASSYQNASAQRLLEIFRDEVFNAPGVCAAYWPDIDTAFSARGDADIRQEEKANLGTLFGILDGTVGPKNGKWFLLCDANTVNMDEAVLSRLNQDPLTVRGPVTPEDFVKLLRDVKLRGRQRLLPLSDAEWKAVGERCVAERLSGRSVDAIAGRILTEMEDFQEPADYFGLPFEEKRRVIEKLSRPVGATRLMELLAAHCRFEREGQEKSNVERFRRRVEEIRLHLSAQAAAMTLLGKKAEG